MWQRKLFATTRSFGSELLDEPRVGGVSESPCDAFFQPGLDPPLIALPVEHLAQLGLGQLMEDRSVHRFGGLRAVDAFFCDRQDLW